MDIDALAYGPLNADILPSYVKRGPTVSSRFQRWFLENIFRVEPVDADDATIDKPQDKGVDGIYVDHVSEEVFVFQTKVRQKATSKLGDTDLKEFHGTLAQFKTGENIKGLLEGNGHAELKNLLRREKIKDRIEAGYTVRGIFCTNVLKNEDAKQFLASAPDLIVYDAAKIASHYVDLDTKSGINGTFKFDVSDSEIVKYSTSEGYQTRIFLAPVLNLVHMT